MYAFYDVLKSVNNNQFTQVTVGMERLGMTWDFRANAYVPIGKTKYVHSIYDTASAQIVNNNIIQHYQISEEMAQMGGDVEIGRTLGTNKLRGYVAAYTFGDNLTGPRARVEYQLNSHVTLNTAVQYDQTRKAQYFVGARFTVGGAKTSNSDSIYARLTDPVVRDVDVVTKAKFSDASRTATDKFWMVDQSASTNGTGTLDNPFTSIDAAIATAPEGAIIYVKGVDGKVYDAGNGTQLKQGQSIIGSVNDLYFDFERNIAHSAKNSNNIFLMSGNGLAPTISGTLIANSHVGIYNLNLIANELARDQAGITLNNAQNVVIGDVSVSGFNAENGTGIAVSNNSQVSVSNLSASDNYIGVDIANSQVSITNTLNINQSQFAGLQLVNSNVTVDALSISNSVQNGVVAFGGSLTVKNNLNVTDAATGILAQAGATVTADSATLTNSNLHLDGAQFKTAHHLDVTADRVLLENGAHIDSDSASVIGQNMSFNNSVWESNNSKITLNGSDALGLLLQNNSQVKFDTLDIKNSSNSVQVESSSTLTVNDSLNTDANITINNATIKAANANLASGDLLMKGGKFDVKDLTTQGNVSITAGKLMVSNALTITAGDANSISVKTGGTIEAGTATISTGDINFNGSIFSADNLTLTTNSVAVSNGGQLSGKTGQLTVNGLEADSFTLSSGGQVHVANISVNDSNILVTGSNSYLETDTLIVAQTAAQKQVEDTATIYQVAISDGGMITARNADSKVDTNKIILNNGTLDLKKGSVTVSNSDADGVSLTNSHLEVQNLTVNNSFGNGVSINGGVLNVAELNVADNKHDGVQVIAGNMEVTSLTTTNNGARGLAILGGSVVSNSITAMQNVNSGIFINAGQIIAKTAVTATKNGRDESGDYQDGALGHGLEIAALDIPAKIEVNLAEFTGSNNTGDGIHQATGSVIISKTTLVSNTQNGFAKTGGRAEIYKATVTGNKANGLYVNSVDAELSLIAKDLTLSGNTGMGLLLTQG